MLCGMCHGGSCVSASSTQKLASASSAVHPAEWVDLKLHPSISSIHILPHLLHPKAAPALPPSTRGHRRAPQQIQPRGRPPLPVIPAICFPPPTFCSICSAVWKISTKKWPQVVHWGGGHPQLFLGNQSFFFVAHQGRPCVSMICVLKILVAASDVPGPLEDLGR